jgi:hypothetical protein
MQTLTAGQLGWRVTLFIHITAGCPELYLTKEIAIGAHLEQNLFADDERKSCFKTTKG